MESALGISEVLDNILLHATPSSQAVAAQACQYWRSHSLPWLWRDLKSLYPLLELLSELEYRGGLWELTTGMRNRERFSLYAGYVRSIDYDQTDPYRGRDGRPSTEALADMFLPHPTFDDPVFPRLTRVRWVAIHRKALMQLAMFLVPTVTALEISCYEPLESACIKVLNGLAYRNILLTELRIAMIGHTPAFLYLLSDVLAKQRRLVRVGLPYYSASRQIVAALAALPFLEEYGSWTFVKYQVHLGMGMDFDWDEGAFSSLKTLGLVTSLADAAKVMSRPHQPRLDDLTLISRDFLEHTHLRNLCSHLSVFQPSLTEINLFIYSKITGIDQSSAMSFDLLRPLLVCAALKVFRIRSDIPMAYNGNDIAYMAGAWSSLEILALCADPANEMGSVTGQPLRSVRSFTQSFRALRELSLYLNTSETDGVSGVPTNPSQCRLSVLDFGTSPVLADCIDSLDLSKAVYVAALLEPHAEMKSERSDSHTRFLGTSETVDTEYTRREKFWSSFATEVYNILAGTTDLTQESREPLR